MIQQKKRPNVLRCLNCGNTIITRPDRFPVCNCGATELLYPGQIYLNNIDIGELVTAEFKQNNRVFNTSDIFEILKYLPSTPVYHAEEAKQNLNTYINNSERFTVNTFKTAQRISYILLKQYFPGFSLVIQSGFQELIAQILMSGQGFPYSDLESLICDSDMQSRIKEALQQYQIAKSEMHTDNYLTCFDYLYEQYPLNLAIRLSDFGVKEKQFRDLRQETEYDIDTLFSMIASLNLDGFKVEDIIEKILYHKNILQTLKERYRIQDGARDDGDINYGIKIYLDETRLQLLENTDIWPNTEVIRICQESEPFHPYTSHSSRKVHYTFQAASEEKGMQHSYVIPIWETLTFRPVEIYNSDTFEEVAMLYIGTYGIYVAGNATDTLKIAINEFLNENYIILEKAD